MEHLMKTVLQQTTLSNDYMLGVKSAGVEVLDDLRLLDLQDIERLIWKVPTEGDDEDAEKKFTMIQTKRD
jgi:ABC-type thiamine transport system substrate-binding protein